MCWMTAEVGPDALARCAERAREHEDSNGHAWGWAWVDGDGLHIEKGTGTMPDAGDEPYADAALAHTRYATMGEKTAANAHPFNVAGQVAIAHNGTWLEAPRHPSKSDSRIMAEMMQETVSEGVPLKDAFSGLGRHTSETLLALTHTGEVLVHSGRFEITQGGGVVASSGRDPLPEGCHEVAP